MRRKTDFFSEEEKSIETVNNIMRKHLELFRIDHKKQELIARKKAEAAAKQKAAQKEKALGHPKIVRVDENETGEAGATITEITDEEAKKMELAELKVKQQAAKQLLKDTKPTEMEKVNDEDEEKSLKQKPNAGNGGQTADYVWHQTLEEISAYIPLPDHTKATMINVKIGINDFKFSMKDKPNEPVLDAKWCKKINAGESIWNIEKDGDKRTLAITLEKFEGKNWWNCLLIGDIEIDTQKVEPENSKLSDLDGETRSTVEKMMFDQAQKAQGKPTSEESEKQDKLKSFMAAHPEMDFSKAKFS